VALNRDYRGSTPQARGEDRRGRTPISRVKFDGKEIIQKIAFNDSLGHHYR
jgi:hypothetical protein